MKKKTEKLKRFIRRSSTRQNVLTKLFAPEEFWMLSQEAVDTLTGGCGPGKLGDLLVPDTVYFLSIRTPCRIHDYMYYIGRNIADKREADRVFLNNMVRTITAGTRNWLLKYLRLLRCRKYYFAVVYFGGPAFWRNKNPRETEKIVESAIIA